MKIFVINSNGKIDYKITLSRAEKEQLAARRAEVIRIAKEEMSKGNYYV
jgi:hypothetical protein